MWGLLAGRTPKLHPAIHTPQTNTQSKLNNLQTNKTWLPHFLCEILSDTPKHKGEGKNKARHPKGLKRKVCCEVTAITLSTSLESSCEFSFPVRKLGTVRRSPELASHGNVFLTNA